MLLWVSARSVRLVYTRRKGRASTAPQILIGPEPERMGWAGGRRQADERADGRTGGRAREWAGGRARGRAGKET